MICFLCSSNDSNVNIFGLWTKQDIYTEQTIITMISKQLYVTQTVFLIVNDYFYYLVSF